MIVNLLQLNLPTELKVDPGLNAAHYNVVYQAIELIVALAIASNYSPQIRHLGHVNWTRSCGCSSILDCSIGKTKVQLFMSFGER